MDDWNHQVSSNFTYQADSKMVSFVYVCSVVETRDGLTKKKPLPLHIPVTRKFLDWKFLFESSQTKIAWKLIPWPENCWLRKFRDCNFLACKFLDPKIPCTENSLKAPWDENSLTRAKGYNWFPRAATARKNCAIDIQYVTTCTAHKFFCANEKTFA